MDANGPFGIYRIRPLYDFSPDIDLPTCMYKMNNLFAETGPQMAAKQDSDEEKLIELEKQQLNILSKLEDLKSKVMKMKEEFGIVDNAVHTNISTPQFCGGSALLLQNNSNVCQDIVIKANPRYPPLSLWAFYHLLSKMVRARLVTYIHSSVTSIPETVKQLQGNLGSEECDVSLTIIWRDVDKDHEMMVHPVHQGLIEGEVNIARYITRFINFNYENDPILSTQIDSWLELVHSSIIHGNNKERQGALRSLNSHLGMSAFIVGDCLTVADVVTWSALIQSKLWSNLPANVKKWFSSLKSIDAINLCGEMLL